MKNNIVSIIVVSYNSSKYIYNTLESILNQTYPTIELIITDDHSSDNTIGIVEAWCKVNRNRFISVKVLKSEKNRGTACNVNKGIFASNGWWVKTLAADDVLERDYVQEMIMFMSTNDIAVAYSNVIYIDSEGRKISANTPYCSKFNSGILSSLQQRDILMRYNPVFAPSLIFTREVIEKHGVFDERYPFCEDLFYLIKITTQGEKIYYNPKYLLRYRKHIGSVQTKREIISRYELDYLNGLFEYAYKEYYLIEKIQVFLIKEILLSCSKVFKNKLSVFSKLVLRIFTFIPYLILKIIRFHYYLAIIPSNKYRFYNADFD